MKQINVVLFDDFTILDALGPVEVFRCLDQFFRVDFFSPNGGRVKSNPELGVQTRPWKEIADFDILLVPGGIGTRTLVNDKDFCDLLGELAKKSGNVLTVCTGSALLAKTGLLSGRSATSNKLAFDWVVQQDPGVKWVRRARWVVDGKYYSSSGISAGIDMALGFVADSVSRKAAEEVARRLEYIWNDDPEEDPFTPLDSV